MNLETEYYRLMSEAQKETRRMRRDNMSSWMVIKAMIKREPNQGGLGIWQFIECTMIGFMMRENAHRDMPTSAPPTESKMPTSMEILNDQ